MRVDKFTNKTPKKPFSPLSSAEKASRASSRASLWALLVQENGVAPALLGKLAGVKVECSTEVAWFRSERYIDLQPRARGRWMWVCLGRTRDLLETAEKKR